MVESITTTAVDPYNPPRRRSMRDSALGRFARPLSSYQYLAHNDDDNELNNNKNNNNNNCSKKNDSLPINTVTWKPSPSPPPLTPSYTEDYWKNQQTTYTTWSSSIWETSFDGPDTEEIIFEVCNDDVDVDVDKVHDDFMEEGKWIEKNNEEYIFQDIFATTFSEDEFFDCLQFSATSTGSSSSIVSFDIENDDDDDVRSKSSTSTDETYPYCSSPECHPFEKSLDEEEDLLNNSNNIECSDSPISSSKLVDADNLLLRIIHSDSDDGDDADYCFQQEVDGDKCDELMDCISDLTDRFQLAQTHNQNLLPIDDDFVKDDNDNDYTTDIVSIEESMATMAPGDKYKNGPEEQFNNADRLRLVRFADEVVGTTALETIYEADYHDETAFKQVVILLPLPWANKFEFVHVEYTTESRISVGTLLQQLPRLSSISVLAKQQYVRLIRTTTTDICRSTCTHKGGDELINALSIQDYELNEDEVLVAIAKGYKAITMMNMAEQLFGNETIMSSVSRKNRWGRTLKRIKTLEELARDVEDDGKQSQKGDDDYSETGYDGDDDHVFDENEKVLDSVDSWEWEVNRNYQEKQHTKTIEDQHNAIPREVQSRISVPKFITAEMNLPLQSDLQLEQIDNNESIEIDKRSQDGDIVDMMEWHGQGDDGIDQEIDENNPPCNPIEQPKIKSKSIWRKSRKILGEIRPAKLIGVAKRSAAKRTSTTASFPDEKLGVDNNTNNMIESRMRPEQTWANQFTKKKRWKPIRSLLQNRKMVAC